MEKLLTYDEIVAFFADAYPEQKRIIKLDVNPKNPLNKNGAFCLELDGHNMWLYGDTIFSPEFNVYGLVTKSTINTISERYRRSINFENQTIVGAQNADVSYIFENGSEKIKEFSGYWYFDETSGRRKVFICDMITLERFYIKPDAWYKLIVHNGVEYAVKSIDVGGKLLELAHMNDPKPKEEPQPTTVFEKISNKVKTLIKGY